MTDPLTRRRYRCRRVTSEPSIDGRLTDPAWEPLPWTEDFVDITGEEARRPRFRTRVKMGWDARFLYVGAWLEEPHVWGTLHRKNSRLYEDNDFELFLDPDGDGLDYYELEINALGTLWELSLPKPYRHGGEPILGCNIPGLRRAIEIRGTINDPADVDEGWSVELALPWEGLAQYNPGRATPPAPGDVWRVNFSRVQWRHRVSGDVYERVPPHGTPRAEGEHPEDNWVWSPQGEINMHIPERWGEVVFEE